jgi:hypothetical protein
VNEINRLDKIIRDAPKRLDELEIIKDNSKLKKLSTKWMNLQIPINQLTREVNKAKTEMPKLEKQLTDLDTEMKLIEKNIKDNEQGIINANITNKAVTKRYEDAFNALNQNLYSIKQEPHESEQAYIQRIKQLDTLKYDPKLFADKPNLENSKQLMRNLKEVISDDGKISEIVKSLEPHEIFDINKFWAKIKDTILKIYGPNNKQSTVNNYLEFMEAILDTIDTKGSLSTVFPSAPTPPPRPVPTPLTPTPPPRPATAPPTPTPTPIAINFDIVLSPDKKTLSVTNTSKSLTIHFKLTKGDEILYSDTDEEFTYKKFFFQDIPTHSNDYFYRVMKTIGLLDATGGKTTEFNYLFGDVSTTKYDFYYNLKDVMKLGKTTRPKKNFNHRHVTSQGITVGWGMKNEEVSKFAHFGKNIILLDKLFYKNILSIKDKKMHSVEHFPNVKVSDTLTDIIFNMCIKNTKPTKEMLNSLKSNDRKLFDLLLYVSGIGKNIVITTTRTRKRNRARTRATCNKVTCASHQTQGGLGREEVRPSFSTPGNCGRPLHSNRPQKIKRYG